MTALYHSASLPVHALVLQLVCVLSSADISLNVADISGGFKDLISSVFEEFCAALFTAMREMLPVL